MSSLTFQQGSINRHHTFDRWPTRNTHNPCNTFNHYDLYGVGERKDLIASLTSLASLASLVSRTSCRCPEGIGDRDRCGVGERMRDVDCDERVRNSSRERRFELSPPPVDWLLLMHGMTKTLLHCVKNTTKSTQYFTDACCR